MHNILKLVRDVSGNSGIFFLPLIPPEVPVQYSRLKKGSARKELIRTIAVSLKVFHFQNSEVDQILEK